MTRNNLAAAYSDRIRGDRAENIDLAIDHYNQALQVLTLESFPEQWATTQNNLAMLYDNQGCYNEAELLYQQVLTIREKVVGPEHPDVVIGLNNLARIYYRQGRYNEAMQLFQRALAMSENILGSLHPLTKEIREQLGSMQ